MLSLLAPRSRRRSLTASLLALVATCLFAACSDENIPTAPALDPSAGPITMIENVRVFDGTKVVPNTTVALQGGKIVLVGTAKRPAGATVVDGRGKTLMPGLIDSHTHAWTTAPMDALAFGVTTMLDMFTDLEWLKWYRGPEMASQQSQMADLISAGTLVTAPKGHGTQFGLPIPTIAAPDSAQAFVDARIAEGSAYIKIVYDDTKAFTWYTPTVDKATLTALIAAAHKRQKLAVVHISDLAAAREAIEAGADGLAHLFLDNFPDDGFGALVASRKAFVIPTISVLERVSGGPGGVPLLQDARLAPYIRKESAASLQGTFYKYKGLKFDAVAATVRQLKAAGVPILAGTDAPNPGTAHGVSMHREIELLVQAGLTPIEALQAATSAPAKAFGLTDRGRIAAGLRADLLLVNGDPTTDILATRDIAGIWKLGVPLDRESYRASLTAPSAGRIANGLQDLSGKFHDVH